MNINLENIDWKDLTNIALKELKSGGKELVDELKNDADKKIVEETMETLAREYMLMLQTNDKEQQDYHRKNIVICRGTLESFEAAVAMKCYYKTLEVVGIAIGVVVVAAIKAMI